MMKKSFISREIIKPSDPTPSSLNTYNLSELDTIAGKAYLPLILLYPNNVNCIAPAPDKARVLKKSLSRALSSFPPFAGRLTGNETPFIDCSDEGVLFVETKIDSELHASQLISGRHEDLDVFVVDDMAVNNSPNDNNNTCLFGVQLNHFACGGMALAVSMSHILGDGRTLSLFVSHWAYVALNGSADHVDELPLNKASSLVSSTKSESMIDVENMSNHVLRTFVFPNSKLSELKDKVVATGSIKNPTRMEVLTSLLYKTAVAATATKSGCFNPSHLFIMVDIRNKLVEKLPLTTVGNFASATMVSTKNKSETSLSMLVGEIKKQKLQLEGVQSVQHAAENLISLMLKVGNEDLYACSSLCGFPFNKVDFGWGKPSATALAIRSTGKNGFMLMDTPDGDGIQAQVILEKETIEIFENDKEMLLFCQINNV